MQTQEQPTPQREASTIFRRVLVPVNFSQASHRSIFVALDLQATYGSTVCVFHASRSDENDRFLVGLGASIDTADIAGESKGALRRLVDNIAPGKAERLEYDANVSEDFVQAIAGKVKEWNATAVVLSPEPHPTLLRTPSEKLVNALNVPVLLLERATPKA